MKEVFSALFLVFSLACPAQWAQIYENNDFAGGLSVSESNQRLVIFGTGNHGIGPMDVQSFDPTPYEGLPESYYKASPVLADENINCGEGAIFDISQIDQTVSVGELKQLDKLVKIWPNPLEDILHYSSESEIYRVTVTDISGRIVYSSKTANKPVGVLNLHLLRPGVYILSFDSKEGQITEKLVKL